MAKAFSPNSCAFTKSLESKASYEASSSVSASANPAVLYTSPELLPPQAHRNNNNKEDRNIERNFILVLHKGVIGI